MPKVKREVSDWFDYPDDPYKGRVQVRLLTQGEQDDIRERCRKLSIDGQISVVGIRTQTIVAAVKGWKNFFGEDDADLACTPANVGMMCLKEDGFAEFVDQCIAELEGREKAKREAESKNS